jgi:ubiquinone/menaquinone biosynthesis C-methylase UbiE
MDFVYKIYQNHSNSYNTKEINKQEVERYRDWFNNNTVDIWRHMRMLEVLNPFLEEYKNSRWLTVGDGHFGTSAIYITQRGGNALPTDIDVSLLELSKSNGWISDYKFENAESLSFANDSFDFVFCKESFHHFPRPYMALYEMLRCTKEAIILTEPRDWLPSPIPRGIFNLFKKRIQQFLKIPESHTDVGNYEEVGNYIYTISEREFQKVALGLNLPMVAFKQFHDVYLNGVEDEKIDLNGKLFNKVKRKIFVNNLQCKLGLNSKNRISAIIFKKNPSIEIISKLKILGFKIVRLPENPFL